jgi:hypothetical protein
MPKLRVVESGICMGSGGLGRGVERFVGFGWTLGCGVVFAPWVLRFLGLDVVAARLVGMRRISHP